MKRSSLAALLFLAMSGSVVCSAEPSFTATFDEAERPSNWTVNTGHWEPMDGVLVCRELEADNHAAASRLQTPLSDGTVSCRLKFVGATGFHVGFDPAPGQLKKKGHLFSLIITPSSVVLKKHRDKADPESKDETKATAKFSGTDDWIDVSLTLEGDDVTATVKSSRDTILITTTDSSFHVAKPTVVFRTIGGDAHLDDVSVKVTKPGIPQAAKPQK
ncbi:MAG: hypothetical protein KDA66_02290 [Planctomycetaceae bacterium]|nr:hypothetical protein [Planctomycetaceae bacterium]